jgi:DNA replication protein DnaC
MVRCIYCRTPEFQVCPRCKPGHEQRWEKVCTQATYRNTNLELLLSKTPQANHEKIKTIIEWPYGKKGLSIFGTTGLGKTRSVWLMLKRWFDLRITPVVFNSGAFSASVAKSYEEDDWRESVFSKDCLFLDDVDKDEFTPRAQSRLFEIVEHYVSDEKPVIITSNVSGDDFRKKFSNQQGSAILRRFREYGHSIALTQ